MAVNSHMVLRLLPHHADLNPVELIWADVKQWLRAGNTTFHINDKRAQLHLHVFKSVSYLQENKISLCYQNNSTLFIFRVGPHDTTLHWI
jgi:hypothetical protein